MVFHSINILEVQTFLNILERNRLFSNFGLFSISPMKFAGLVKQTGLTIESGDRILSLWLVPQNQEADYGLTRV